MAEGEIDTLETRGLNMTADELLRVNGFLEATVLYRSQFIWMVRRMTGCTDEAEDIVQAAFMKAYASLHRFRGDARVSTWLRIIVQNTARDHVRSRGRQTLIPLERNGGNDGHSAVVDFEDPQLSPEEGCARREVSELLIRAINRLSPYSRQAIQMCILEEFSRTDAAMSLNVSVASIKSRISRGKRHLHNALQAQIGGAATIRSVIA